MSPGDVEPDAAAQPTPRPPLLGRRGLLSGTAALAVTGGLAGVLAGCQGGSDPGRPGHAARAVDEPHAHGPVSYDEVAHAVGKGALVVRGRHVISGHVTAKAVDVRAGGTLEFDPHKSSTLTVTGNVVVRGRLRMRPSSVAVVHRLQFKDVEESAFVGTTMGPVATDVGLWVMGAGRLHLQGTRRRGWNRRGSHSTWRAGDEVLRAPLDTGDYDTWAVHKPGDP